MDRMSLFPDPSSMRPSSTNPPHAPESFAIALNTHGSKPSSESAPLNQTIQSRLQQDPKQTARAPQRTSDHSSISPYTQISPQQQLGSAHAIPNHLAATQDPQHSQRSSSSQERRHPRPHQSSSAPNQFGTNQMQISSLSLLHGGGASSAPASNTPANYGGQVQFTQQGHPQGNGTSGIGSSGLTSASGPFPSGQGQMQSHQGLHQQTLPGSSHHIQNTFATGSISNSILPASIVDDASGAANNQYQPNGQHAESLQGGYPWSEPQPHAMGSQAMSNSRHRMQQSYAQQSSQQQPQMRPQQAGMLPLPVSASRSSTQGTLGGPGSSMHSGMPGSVSSGVLGPIGGNNLNGMVNGIPQGPGLGGSLPTVAMGMNQPFPDTEGSGGRSFTGHTMDVMGSNQLRNKPSARGPYDHNPGFSHHLSNPLGGSHGLPEITAQNLNDAPFGMKQEDSSAGYRPQQKRPARPRSRRKSNQPPGTTVPVHLRNPKKGRARVFRKCQYCNHDNHIRRSNCDACKRALPAGKRRRDGSLVFSSQRQSHSSPNGAPPGIMGQGPAASPQVSRNVTGLPVQVLQRPSDPNGNN